MFFRKLEKREKGSSSKEPIAMAAYSFRARYPNAIIRPNDEVMELLALHPKCPKTTFLWSGEFDFINESGEYGLFFVGGDGPLFSADTLVVLLEG